MRRGSPLDFWSFILALDLEAFGPLQVLLRLLSLLVFGGEGHCFAGQKKKGQKCVYVSAVDGLFPAAFDRKKKKRPTN